MRSIPKLSCAIISAAAFLVMLGPSLSMAQMGDSPAPAVPASAPSTTASQFIQDLGNQAISVMADKTIGQDQRTQKYRELLQASFDMPVIGHFVLGRAWNTATPQQQQEFMKLFEQNVLKTYGDRLSFYSGQGFHVTGERKENDKDSVVSSEVVHPNGSAPTKVDWRVRQENGRFAVIDVVVSGVSQSITQRDEYAAIIQRNNGNLEGLLALMRQRAQGQQQ